MKPPPFLRLHFVVAALGGIMAILLAGCEAPMGRYSFLDKSYPARTGSAPVEIFQTGLPARPFVEISRLDVHVEQGFFARPELTNSFPELIRQARLSGADAIINLKERWSGLNESSVLHITATGIKYQEPR